MRSYFSITVTFCYSLFATEQKDWILDVENYFQRLPAFEADLIQQSNDLKQCTLGKIRIKRPILKIELQDGKKVLINGNKIKYYNAKLNDITEHNKNPFSVFLKKNVQLKKHVKVKSVKIYNNELHFRIRPNVDVGAEIELIFDVVYNKLTLKKWVIIYDNGNNVSITLKNIKDTLSCSIEELTNL